MHLSKIVLSFFTISVGAVTAFRRGGSSVTDSMLSMPRGGAGPIDADMAAKVYTGLVGAQGALDYLSPKTVDKLYNISLQSDPLSAFLQQYVGGNQISVAIILVAAVFMDGVSGLKAIGFGLLPGVLAIVKSLLDGQPGELGIQLPMQYINGAIQAYVMYALLSGADHAGTVLKFYCAYTGLATAQCRIAPQAALKAWGFPAEGTATQAFATQLIGQSGLALTVAMYTLGVEKSGGEASTAVGRVAVVYLASLAEFLLSGTFTSLGVDVTKCYPWVVISTVVAATLLL